MPVRTLVPPTDARLGFQPTMIGFDRFFAYWTVLFNAAGAAHRSLGQRRRLVGDDLERWAVVADRIREEPARSDAVAAFRHVQVDDPAMVIDGAVDLVPHARRLHIGLVDEPVVTDGISVRVSCVDQYRCEALHPSEQRDVINLDTAFGEEFFEIAV